jgi:hypothetical protein
VLVNVGHEISTVNVVQDGSPVLTRDIPFGSRRLRERPAPHAGLTAEEADAVIQGRSERQAEFLPLLAQGSEELAVGIERAVAFLSLGGGRPTARAASSSAAAARGSPAWPPPSPTGSAPAPRSPTRCSGSASSPTSPRCSPWKSSRPC